jgi:hypothetical protein
MKSLIGKLLFGLLLALADVSQLFAQQYLWPLRLDPELSSRFGDCRYGHWHAGIDCRTRGQTGFKVYAVENGYISKVRVGYWGYGKSMYIKLNDGNTIVYGHLQSFTPEIDRFVYNQQINQRRYYQEIEFKPGQYPVRKGDVVAISGQSGVGYPHLHMEIRDKDNIPINPQKSYYYLPDKTSPIVVKLAIKRFLEYGINNYHDLEFLPVVGKNGDYRVVDTVAVYGQAAFAVNAYDQQGGFSYGIYSAKMFMDGFEIFAFARDSLNYLTGSQIYYVNDYELQSLIGDKGDSDDDRAVFYRLYCQPYDVQTFYGGYRFPDGLIDGDKLDNAVHKIVIALSDINGNTSKIRLYVKKATLPTPGIKRFIKYSKETNILIENAQEGAGIEAQICRVLSGGYQKIGFRYDAETNLLTLPVMANYRTLRIRVVNETGEFSSWLVIDPDLKKQRINQFADYWEFKNVQQGIQHPFSCLFNNIIQKNVFNENLWQGLVDVRGWKEPIKSKSPSVNCEQITYFCDSGATIYSPDSSVWLEIEKKILYGKTIVSLSSLYPQDKYSYSFEIGPEQLLFNGNAKLNVTIDRLLIDPKTMSLYVRRGSQWTYKAGIVDSKVSCSVSGGGEFAFIADNKPPSITGLTPSNGAILRESKPLISCKISDNLSGISRESQLGIFIDNKWVPGDYDITTGVFSYQVNQPLKYGEHEVSIKAIDNQGNVASTAAKFRIVGKY